MSDIENSACAPMGIDVEVDTCHHHCFPNGSMSIIDGCLWLSWETDDGLDTKVFAVGEWKSVERFKRPVKEGDKDDE